MKTETTSSVQVAKMCSLNVSVAVGTFGSSELADLRNPVSTDSSACSKAMTATFADAPASLSRYLSPLSGLDIGEKVSCMGNGFPCSTRRRELLVTLQGM